MIDADAQDLGIEPRELGRLGLVRGQLVRSDRRPGKGEERDDNGTPAEAFFESHSSVEVTRQGEVGGFLPDLQLHATTPFDMGLRGANGRAPVRERRAAF
jgi:hypothetical protein